MRDGQIAELIRCQMHDLQGWVTSRLQDQSEEMTRLKEGLADAHNLAVHTNLRAQAIIFCIANPERYFIRGWRVPLLWRPFAADYAERVYQRLLDDLMNDLRAREAKKNQPAPEPPRVEKKAEEKPEPVAVGA